jgi:hypothetical protein
MATTTAETHQSISQTAWLGVKRQCSSVWRWNKYALACNYQSGTNKTAVSELISTQTWQLSLSLSKFQCSHTCYGWRMWHQVLPSTAVYTFKCGVHILLSLSTQVFTSVILLKYLCLQQQYNKNHTEIHLRLTLMWLLYHNINYTADNIWDSQMDTSQ